MWWAILIALFVFKRPQASQGASAPNGFNPTPQAGFKTPTPVAQGSSLPADAEIFTPSTAGQGVLQGPTGVMTRSPLPGEIDHPAGGGGFGPSVMIDDPADALNHGGSPVPLQVPGLFTVGRGPLPPTMGLTQGPQSDEPFVPMGELTSGAQKPLMEAPITVAMRQAFLWEM